MFFKRLKYLVEEIYLTADTRPAVLACIISAYIWGFTLIAPPEILTRPYYRGLAAISLNEDLWGILFLILGTVQLVRLIPKKEVPKYIIFEFILRLFSCCVWTYVAFTAAFQIPVPPVVGDTICIMLAAWWDFLRYDGKVSEKQYISSFQPKE